MLGERGGVGLHRDGDVEDVGSESKGEIRRVLTLRRQAAELQHVVCVASVVLQVSPAEIEER